MSYFPIDQGESHQKNLEEAIDEWNSSHPRQTDKIAPNSPKINHLGKTILFSYDKNTGFRLEEIGWGNRCLAFFARIFRAIHLGYEKSRLGESQKKEITLLKKMLAIASQPLFGKTPDQTKEIKIAKVHTLFGKEIAHAYELIMYPNPSKKEEIEKIIPHLESSLKKTKNKISKLNEYPSDLDLADFESQCNQHIKEYYKELRAKYKREILQQMQDKSLSPSEYAKLEAQYDAAIKSEKFFKLFYSKIVERNEVPPQLNSLAGLFGTEADRSILEDLRTFQKEKGKELSEEERARVASAIAHLEFAVQIGSQQENPKLCGEMIHKALKTNESITFPMGTKVHRCLCHIKKLSPTQFCVTIINTGEGGKIIQKVSDKHGVIFKAADVEYQNVGIEALIPEFFYGLQEMHANAVKMEDVYIYMDGHLGARATGKERHAQLKGTCAMRCVQEFLYEHLGKELFHRYHLLATEQAIHSFEDEINHLSPIALKMIFPTPSDSTEDKKRQAENIDALRIAAEHTLARRQARVIRILD